ncbi:MAG: hypothetical protein R3345_02065 [Fulvivirga sp.]|nr:hypothetical protein [Fulvivirga sp.]
MIGRTIIGVFFLLASHLTHAIDYNSADSIPLINSSVVIEEGIALHNNEAYKEALEKFHTIHKNDTNYVMMVSQAINSYYQLEEYDKVISYCKSHLTKNTIYRSHFYHMLGKALEENGQRKEAINTYRDGLKLFPYDVGMLHSLSVSYVRDEDYEKAKSYLKKAININPYYSSSHLLLANLMVLEGKKVRAMMGYSFYLCLEPNNNSALVLYNNMLNDGIEFEGTVDKGKEKLFYELELLVRSKVALNDKFKSEIDFEAAVAQQTELMFQKLDYAKNTEDFWMEFYVPLLTSIHQRELSNLFIYYILKSTNNKKVEKELKKNESELKEFFSFANEKLKQYRSTKNVDGSSRKKNYWYYDQNQLAAIGNKNAEGDLMGDWEFFYDNGQLSAIGTYTNEGSKEGTWHYYYNTGILKNTEDYESGELNGIVKYYSEYGTLANEIPYKNGTVDGEIKRFYPCGQLEEAWHYVDNVKHGKGEFLSPTGIKQLVYNNDSSKLHGPYTRYHLNGEVKEAYSYDQGVMDGEYVSYYPSGKIESKGKYVQDTLVGEWVGYHKNGRLNYIGSFKNGEKAGVWKYYYDNGQPSSIEHYIDSAGITMRTEFYTKEGELLNIEYRADDMLVGYKNFSNHKVIDSAFDKSGNLDYKAYYIDGRIKAEGTYKNGSLNGAYLSYHHNGLKQLEAHYSNGKLDGPYVSYYERGSVERKSHYKEGVEEGYYKYYYENGQLKYEGWIVNGKQQQEWRNYYPDGTLSDKDYFIDGEYHGEVTTYDPDGIKEDMLKYHKGLLVEYEQYDTLENVIHQGKLNYGSGIFSTVYASGETKYYSEVKCGELNDDQTSYFKNGKILRVSPVENEQYNGLYQSYFENGNKHVEGIYSNNLMNGKWTWYDFDGNIESDRWYTDDLLDSVINIYYDNQQLQSVCHYVNDTKYGNCQYYDPNGNLQIEKFYGPFGISGYQYLSKDSSFIKKDFDGNGEIIAYYQNGKISSKQNYKYEIFEGTQYFYYPNGQLQEEISFSEAGIKDGLEKEYYPDGTLKLSKEFKNDFLHGKVLEYYPNGQLKQSTAYVYDQRHGYQIRYSKEGKVIFKVYFRNDQMY